MHPLPTHRDPPPALGHSFLRTRGWKPENRRALETLIARPPVPDPVAALDLDHTCLIGDVSETALALLDEERGAGGALVAEYEAHCRSNLAEAFVALVFTLLAERTEPDGRALAEWALDEGGRRGLVAVRPAMREFVWALHRFGWTVYVVSASPQVLAQAAAARLGVHPHTVIGMQPTIDGDGRFVRPILEPIPFRAGKLALFEQATGRAPTLAVGDSPYDWPLLAGAVRALLLDRGHPDLLAEARASGVWIQPESDLR